MRKTIEHPILRLRLREFTLDGVVGDAGPWIMAKAGGRFLGSSSLGGCTKIERDRPDRPYQIRECSTTKIALDRCDEAEVQAIATTFGIPGVIEFYDDGREPKTFPHAGWHLFESPFWDAMVAYAAERPKGIMQWGTGDDRTGMGWRRGMVQDTEAFLLARRSRRPTARDWGHEIVAAQLTRTGRA